jgi:hypothetical protein
MTISQMKEYSTDELIAYVERTDAKYKKASKFIRRNSFSNWKNASAAICAEIQKRMLSK